LFDTAVIFKVERDSVTDFFAKVKSCTKEKLCQKQDTAFQIISTMAPV